MYEAITEPAKKAAQLAREEAGGLGHDQVGPEHLLLGLLREEDGVGGRALRSLGIEPTETREAVGRAVGRGEESTGGPATFGRRYGELLMAALSKAQGRGHPRLGTDDLLLVLAEDAGGMPARVLGDLGVGPEQVRREVERRLPLGEEDTPMAQHAPWRMSSDVPEFLHFAAYLNHRENLFEDPDAPDPTPGAPPEARQWQRWWERLVGTGDAATLRDEALRPDPTEFTSPEDYPFVRALCRRHWDAFRGEWSGRNLKMRLVELMHDQLHEVRVQEMVSRREAELGRPARPFALEVAFVNWTGEYRRMIGNERLVLGEAYLQRENLDRLRELLEDKIVDLA